MSYPIHRTEEEDLLDLAEGDIFIHDTIALRFDVPVSACQCERNLGCFVGKRAFLSNRLQEIESILAWEGERTAGKDVSESVAVVVWAGEILIQYWVFSGRIHETRKNLKLEGRRKM